MVRNSELKTDFVTVTSGVANITAGGQVPAGMKRWVTFVSLDSGQVMASHLGVYFASVNVSNPSIASIVATGNRKLLAHLRTTQSTGLTKRPLQIPKKASVDTPLFSIAGGNWLGLAATITTALVNVQYFDE